MASSVILAYIGTVFFFWLDFFLLWLFDVFLLKVFCFVGYHGLPAEEQAHFIQVQRRTTAVFVDEIYFEQQTIKPIHRKQHNNFVRMRRVHKTSTYVVIKVMLHTRLT